jgi:Uma2 family endonuclease
MSTATSHRSFNPEPTATVGVAVAVGSGLNKRTVEYPTSDGKPMAETDWHRKVMIALIQGLDYWFADEPRAYVSGNMLVYYVPGDKRRHVSLDVFVVKGVPKKDRDYFLIWEEGKSPSTVIEVTSKSTKQEDLKKKMVLYQDVLKVKEYILFDPLGDYLKPRLQGYRLQKGVFVPIDLVDGRLPSKEIGLRLEAVGTTLRLYDPKTRKWLPTPEERANEPSHGRRKHSTRRNAGRRSPRKPPNEPREPNSGHASWKRS